MVRSFVIAVLLLVASPVLAGVEFAARLEQSVWTVSNAPDRCEMIHPIPRYGVARFEALRGHPLGFRLDTDLSGASGETARLVLVPPAWRHDLEPRSFGEAPSEARALRLDAAGALELYHALEAGYQLSVEHVAPGRGGLQVAAAISPVRFRQVMIEFQQCRDRMAGLDFPAISHVAGSADLQRVAGRAAGPDIPPVAGRMVGPDFQPVAEWRVHFETNLSRLDALGHETLRQVIAAWQRQRGLRVIVAGHADVRGGDVINDPLSRRRAEAVHTFLRVYGIPRDRIEVRSFGHKWPLDPGDGEAAWALNRRAMVWLAP
jgi:sodium-type flagellar protein MotY